MSKLDILNQNWIDIVFEGRNKEYGAYQLRKENAKNTNKAVIIGGLFFILAISSPIIIKLLSGGEEEEDKIFQQTEVVLATPPPIDKKAPPPPPPVEPPPPKVDQVRFPPPVVKPDEQVVEEEPPTIKDLEKADPGQKTLKGNPDADIQIENPTFGDGPVNQKVTEDTNEIFTTVEQMPEYPGGLEAFYKYLGNSINYPPVARENNIQGRVTVNFVVERDGSLTDIKVLRGIGGGCDEEAIRVLKKSKAWKPGVQNGRPVRVSYTVPVMFRLSE
ncbi:energy transducer TonB [Pedobacter glucosidilyticus]|uniref:energy transducer TonB n=1 Tax=Pedobacter glucosidilyticus TaxID=1122941 RepID=UPI0003FC3987|nr:energy transducer TonB [Pedobacter glucosidilyticus]